VVLDGTLWYWGTPALVLFRINRVNVFFQSFVTKKTIHLKWSFDVSISKSFESATTLGLVTFSLTTFILKLR
jgi:hypothetical protein